MSIVRPLSTPAAYLGGKSKLAERIIPFIQNTPHNTYVEPFIGMGGIFFRRTIKPKLEVINDYNGEVANFFRVLQRHINPLIEHLQFFVSSRELFAQQKATPPESLTDLERAARFYYLQKIAFGGRSYNPAFGTQNDRPRFDISKLKEDLRQFHERLSGVMVENDDFEMIINRYDTPDSLFYLDPPYYNCENDYGKDMFCKDDFVRLSNILAEIKGKFILSLNSAPEVKEIFGQFIINEEETSYSVGKENNKKVREVIITNQPILQESFL